MAARFEGLRYTGDAGRPQRGARSGVSRPWERARQPQSGGAFRRFATRRECRIASWRGRDSRARDPRGERDSLTAGVRFERSRSSERAGQPQSRSALRRFATPGKRGIASGRGRVSRAHDPRSMWYSFRAAALSDGSRPSDHAEQPKSRGAFRGSATHGGCGAASEEGAFRGFATLGADGAV